MRRNLRKASRKVALVVAASALGFGGCLAFLLWWASWTNVAAGVVAVGGEKVENRLVMQVSMNSAFELRVYAADLPLALGGSGIHVGTAGVEVKRPVLSARSRYTFLRNCHTLRLEVRAEPTGVVLFGGKGGDVSTGRWKELDDYGGACCVELACTSLGSSSVEKFMVGENVGVVVARARVGGRLLSKVIVLYAGRDLLDGAPPDASLRSSQE